MSPKENPLRKLNIGTKYITMEDNNDLVMPEGYVTIINKRIMMGVSFVSGIMLGMIIVAQIIKR